MERPWLAHYEDGVPAEAEIPNYPVTQNLIEAAEEYPDRPALIFGNVVEPLGNMLMDASIGYGSLLSLTRRFAAALQQFGVEKGDRVAVHLPNCPQFVIAYYATLMVGGIVVPCNPQYVGREIAHQLSDSGAETIITLSLTYPIVNEVRDETPLKRVIVTNIKEYFPPLLKLLFTLAIEKKEGHYQDLSGEVDTFWFQDVLSAAPTRPAHVEMDPDDTAVLMYTGGTTGVPKAAQLTQRNVQANAVQIMEWLPRITRGSDSILTSLPLFHSYGMTTCMNLAILTANSMILIANPRVLIHVLKSINKHHPTLYPGVPAMYVAINNTPSWTSST